MGIPFEQTAFLAAAGAWVAVMGLLEELGLTELEATEFQLGGETASDSCGVTNHMEHPRYDEMLSGYDSCNGSLAPSTDVSSWEGHREHKP